MRPFNILSNIRDIKAGKREITPGAGICENVGIRVIPVKLLKSWEHYSLDCLYPVPSGEKGVTPEFKYISTVHSKETNLWDKNTKYGQFRWKLLDYLEEYLKDCTTYIVNNVGVCDYEDCDGELTDEDYVVTVKDSLVPQDESIEEILSKAFDEGKNLEDIPCVIKTGFF